MRLLGRKRGRAARLGLAGAVLAAVLAAAPAAGSEVGRSRIFGAGGILGEPTGGTLKVWIGDNRFAFQAHAAISWWGIHRLALFADVLWHPHIITDNRHFDLLWYFGVGGGAGIRAPWDDYHYHSHHDREDRWEPDPAVWIRVPFGFPFRFHRFPMEAFIEFGPTIGFDIVHDDTDVFLHAFAAVGCRWYF